MSQTKTTYTPRPGEHISDAIDGAISVARPWINFTGPVEFTFNGITLTVEQGSTRDSLLHDYHNAVAKSQMEYEASPAYTAQKREEEIRGKQATDTAHIEFHHLLLNAAVENWAGVANHLANFTDASDHTGCTFDRMAGVTNLLNAGFKPGEGVGDPEVVNQTDFKKVVRYLVGQAINFMVDGKPPHPMTAVFARRILNTAH